MYAIINHKTEKFVCGTYYRYQPPHQRTSFDKMLTFSSREEAENEMVLKKCNNDYVVVGIVAHVYWLFKKEGDNK